MNANGNAGSESSIAGPDRQAPRPGAWLALAMLLAINLFNYIDRQVLSAVEPKIREVMLKGDPNAHEKTGNLAMAFMLSYMVIAPIFGWLGDRYSRWLLIGVGVILWSLASGASGWYWPVEHAFTYLLITRCFVGVGEAAYGPVAPTVISDLYPVKMRGQVLSWFYLAIPVGSALGYTLGGIVSNRDSEDAWRWAFFLVVPPGLLLGLLCFFLRDPPRGQADPGSKTSKKVKLADYGILLRTPSFVLDTLGMTAMTFALGALAFWMPAYLKHRQVEPVFGLDPVALFGAGTALFGLLATLAGGILGDMLRSRYSGSYFLVSGVAMIIGFPMIILVIITPFPLSWVFIFLAVFFLFFNTGPTNTILANVTHSSMRSTAFALNIFVLHALGDAVSPRLVGYVADRSSLDVGFVVVSLATLLGGLFWLWGARYLEEDTRRAPTLLE